MRRRWLQEPDSRQGTKKGKRYGFPSRFEKQRPVCIGHRLYSYSWPSHASAIFNLSYSWPSHASAIFNLSYSWPITKVMFVVALPPMLSMMPFFEPSTW